MKQEVRVGEKKWHHRATYWTTCALHFPDWSSLASHHHVYWETKITNYEEF